jgi:transposase
VTSVASKLQTMSTLDMIEALIAGQRDRQALASLAHGKLRGKHAALVEALTGRFDEHHGELARILLAKIDRLDVQITRLTARVELGRPTLPPSYALTTRHIHRRWSMLAHDRSGPATQRHTGTQP